MQHLEQGIEETQGSVVGGTVDGLWLAVNVGRLHHLEIPARELVPEEFVDGHQCLRDAVFLQQVVHLGIGLLQLGVEPGDGHLVGDQCVGAIGVVGHLPSFHQSEGIPYLIVEVASLLAQGLVEEDVVTGRSREHHAHAHAVGTELLDELNGVRRVAE